ncbi:MAG: hypothetical protein K6U09_04490 [Acidobacteriia bacterium]|jgi:hypothetical protein|nr:hypothetical protein [Terriglobia bacterium]
MVNAGILSNPDAQVWSLWWPVLPAAASEAQGEPFGPHEEPARGERSLREATWLL